MLRCTTSCCEKFSASGTVLIWNHKGIIVQEIRVYEKAGIAASKVACNDE